MVSPRGSFASIGNSKCREILVVVVQDMLCLVLLGGCCIQWSVTMLRKMSGLL